MLVKKHNGTASFEVTQNASGEVFVRLLSNPEVQLRLTAHGNEIGLCALGCEWVPSSFGGAPGFALRHRGVIESMDRSYEHDPRQDRHYR